MGISGGLEAEAYDRTYSDAVLVRRSGAYFRPHAKRVLTVAGVVAISSLVATVIPIIISQGIDALNGNPGLQVVIALTALVTVLGALNWVLNFVRLHLSARAVGDV